LHSHLLSQSQASSPAPHCRCGLRAATKKRQ
jgi:hypothetical protein